MSLVVCIVTPAAVYLSADSRYIDAPVELRDSARKLTACGPAGLCGLLGLLRFTRTEFERDGDDLARQTTFELSDIVNGLKLEWAACDGPGFAAMFAQRFHEALVPFWERFATELDEPFGLSEKASSIVVPSLWLAQLFYVNRAASGRAFLATIDLRHSVRRSSSGRYSSVLEAPVIRPILYSPVVQPGLYARGTRWCARLEPVSSSVHGDVEALKIIEGVFERARLDARCAAAIGGPVDVAVIDTLGRRWLKRKAGMRDCQEPVPES